MIKFRMPEKDVIVSSMGEEATGRIKYFVEGRGTAFRIDINFNFKSCSYFLNTVSLSIQLQYAQPITCSYLIQNVDVKWKTC